MVEITVDIVTVEQRLWQGQASFVSAQTLDGEIGVLAGHEPVMAQLSADGVVTVVTPDQQRVVFTVDGGFLSVTGPTVTVLAETAQVLDAAAVAEAKRVVGDASASPEAVVIARRQLRAAEHA